MIFLLILVGFLEKGTKSANLGNFEVLCRSIGIPHSNLEVLCRGVALFTDMCFCHVFPFHYSKDLSIGLMRSL